MNTSTQDAVAIRPTQAEIANRAHAIYVARGGAPGFELDDWLRAESDLMKKGIAASTKKATVASLS